MRLSGFSCGHSKGAAPPLNGRDSGAEPGDATGVPGGGQRRGINHESCTQRTEVANLVAERCLKSDQLSTKGECKMESKDWIQLLVGTVIIGGLAFLGTHLFEMKGTLSKVETRVSNIADDMPALGHRIAWREVESPIRGAVISTVAQSTLDGGWQKTFVYYDMDSQALLRYSVELADQSDLGVSYQIVGSAIAHERYATPFSEMAYCSKEIGQPVKLPGIVDQHSSFVFRSARNEDYLVILNDLLGEPETIKMDLTPQNWPELTDAVNSNTEVLRRKSPDGPQ